jgi:hypothetical protein
LLSAILFCSRFFTILDYLEFKVKEL